MSCESGGMFEGGTEVPHTNFATASYVDAVNAAKRREVVRDRDFMLVCAESVALDVVVDAVIASVSSPEELDSVQQITDKKFIFSLKSREQAVAYSLQRASSLGIPGTTWVCKWLGADVKRIKVAYLPTAIDNSKLEEVLSTYGRVLRVTDEIYTGRPVQIKTGTRFVDLEMARPVPNLITVCGFTVPAVYKGVVIQCRRCSREGHLKAACTTPFCERCKNFGHEEKACAAPCLKCSSSEHHWRDCKARNYAFAAASGDATKAGDTETTRPEATSHKPSEYPIPTTDCAVRREHEQAHKAALNGDHEEAGIPATEPVECTMEVDVSIDRPEENPWEGSRGNGSGTEKAKGVTAEHMDSRRNPLDKETDDAAMIAINCNATASSGSTWHVMQTRASKRKQTVCAPARLPDPRRGSVKPNKPA